MDENENKSKKQELQEQIDLERKQTEERIELLKIKSGTATEADIENFAPKDEPAPAPLRTFRQKWDNFWYQHKAHVIFGVILAVFAVFIADSILSVVKPDVTVGIVSEDANFYALTEDIAAALEPYAKDYNGDGKVSVSVLRFIGTNASGANMTDQNQAEVLRLNQEFQSNTMIMIITNKENLEKLDAPAGTFEDGTTLFPGDKNAVLDGYLLDNTTFSKDIGWPEMPDGYFAAFRAPQNGFGELKTFEDNFDNALEMWRNFINNTPAN
jgi:hypothetical protein